MNTELLEGFNEQQREAVLYCDGPSLVIAGAGSGKTRVLTHKIAYLLDQGLEPWSILALTFTNKAAREMKDRIARIVGEERARRLWMGTFHSIFLRILQTEHEAIGFSSRFTIYDADDSVRLVKAIIKEMSLDDKIYKPSTILGKISGLKNQLVSPEAYYANNQAYQSDLRSRIPLLREIYKRYVSRCRQADAMDFDDILVCTHNLFEANEEIRRKYVERFRYVLVDEYQDTNAVQHRIVWQLTKERRRVCVVGDDSQSIYSFRGANIDNILTFTDAYQEAKLFKLERNYRSTQMIVGAANSLIKKNSMQIRKNVFSENEQGDKIQITEAYSDVEEGMIVVRKIAELRRREHYGYSDFAILYRTNSQSRVFEEALRKNGLPYRIYGGHSFYHYKEIKDIIAYFRLAINPNDETAFKRIVNYPKRGIGDTTVAKISEVANSNDVSLWTVLQSPLSYGLNFTAGTARKLEEFRLLIADFIGMAESESADRVGSDIVKRSGIAADLYADTSPEGQNRQRNMEELLNGMQEFCASRMEEGAEHVTIADYLSEISLLSDMDKDAADTTDRVTLMTVHSAKGLEFPTVFIVGMEENLFPNQMSSSSVREMEEERRLFYVAITRACRHCFITYAKSRFLYGKMEFGTRSRFLSDIAPEFVTFSGGSRQTSQSRMFSNDDVELPWKRNNYQHTPHNLSPLRTATSRLASSPQGYHTEQNNSSLLTIPSSLSVGSIIEHERFGIGKVTAVDGAGENCKATVAFENVGTKQLLLKFAKFKVVG